LRLFAYLMKKVSILGCGWLGSSLAEDLIHDGVAVNGSTTTSGKLDALAAKDINPFLIDLSTAVPDEEFMDCDVLIIAVRPKLRKHDSDVYLRQMENAFTAVHGARPMHIVFVSSTSVYPDLNRVVDENDADGQSPIRKAENIFLRLKKQTTSVIRFAGLVGPGRHPGRFLSGKKVAGGTNPVNLIHLDDCVRIIRKVIELKRPVIMNACADMHPSKQEFYIHASRLLDLPPPLFEDNTPSGYKIISSDLLKSSLRYEFMFSDPMTMTF
jgi:nucleoside-diphosphate-sugar epimerase